MCVPLGVSISASNSFWVKSYATFSEVQFFGVLDLENSKNAISFLMITSLLLGLFGPSKVQTHSPNTALEVPLVGFVVGRVVGTPEAKDSPISPNSILYSSMSRPLAVDNVSMPEVTPLLTKLASSLMNVDVF